jgi:uroporphyrin-III C-methyltransferase
MKNLGEIIKLFKAVGKNQTPVAIIQNGTRPNQHKVIGTVETIEVLVKEQQVGSPAIIVIGNVVALQF